MNKKVGSDIEIARDATMKPIREVAAKLGIPEEHLLPYGHTKAKISMKFIESLKDKPDGKLILVTAISPTPAGVGLIAVTRISLPFFFDFRVSRNGRDTLAL